MINVGFIGCGARGYGSHINLVHNIIVDILPLVSEEIFHVSFTFLVLLYWAFLALLS